MACLKKNMYQWYILGRTRNTTRIGGVGLPSHTVARIGSVLKYVSPHHAAFALV